MVAKKAGRNAVMQRLRGKGGIARISWASGGRGEDPSDSLPQSLLGRAPEPWLVQLIFQGVNPRRVLLIVIRLGGGLRQAKTKQQRNHDPGAKSKKLQHNSPLRPVIPDVVDPRPYQSLSIEYSLAPKQFAAHAAKGNVLMKIL
jgi:hypothetical protein